MGKLLFYLLWPIIWFYAPLTRRVRVILIHNNKVLLVVNKLGPGKWQFPGGGIKFGESVNDAAKREITEELYLKINNIRVLNKDPIICKQYGLLMRYHYVTAKIINPSESLRISNELLSAKWADQTKLEDCLPEVSLGLELNRDRQ